MRSPFTTVLGQAITWASVLPFVWILSTTAGAAHGSPWRPDRSIIIQGSPSEKSEIRETSAPRRRFGAAAPSGGAESGARGRIFDDEMNPVAGATVFFGSHETVTGEDGSFSVAGAAAGYHELVVSAEGFIEERSEILVNERMGEIEMLLRRAKPAGQRRVERRPAVEAAMERRERETFLEAAPTLSGTSGLIDLPDTGIAGAGQKSFGAHFMRMDGVTKNADLFAYKYNQGIGDSMEFSLAFVDSKLGGGSSEISSGTGILGMKYRIPESLEKVDFALVGQLSQERSQFFGVADFRIPEGKLSVSLKNDEAGRNAALNLGVELGMPEFDRLLGLGRSTFIFETEQADARFNIFNAGLRHRTGKHQVLDIFILQDRRIKDDNGNRSRNQRTYGIGGSLEF